MINPEHPVCEQCAANNIAGIRSPGGYYEFCSKQCLQAFIEDNQAISNCCNASMNTDTRMCSKCHDHCGPVSEE